MLFLHPDIINLPPTTPLSLNFLPHFIMNFLPFIYTKLFRPLFIFFFPYIYAYTLI